MQRRRGPMATKDNPGKFDCYEKADPDEPMFVLLARDRHAAALVEMWWYLRADEGEDDDVLQEAKACVDAMRGWAASKGRRTHDFVFQTHVGVKSRPRT